MREESSRDDSHALCTFFEEKIAGTFALLQAFEKIKSNRLNQGGAVGDRALDNLHEGCSSLAKSRWGSGGRELIK